MAKRRSKGAYMISAVAEMYEIHPQTLRLYEREGLLKPSRTDGNTRLYTDEDLDASSSSSTSARDLGVNIAGIGIILQMRERMEEMNRQMQSFVEYVRTEMLTRFQQNAPGAVAPSSPFAGLRWYPEPPRREVPRPSCYFRTLHFNPATVSLARYAGLCMAYVILALGILGLLTSTGFAVIVLWAVPGYLRERKRALAQTCERPGFTPQLSLLKPLHGAEPGLEADIESFFQQDYPEYELLFCARSDQDAGLAIARCVAARHPAIAVQFLSTGGKPDYINAKVASMEKMEAAARYDILVISDSDVRVSPDYMRAVALAFVDPKVGGMTCPSRRGSRRRPLGAPRSCRHVGRDDKRRSRRAHHGRHAICTRSHHGFSPRDDLPNWRLQSYSRLLRRRFCVGKRDIQAGEGVVLSHHVIDHMVINSNFLDSMKHQVRSMKSTRFSRPAGHFATSLSFSLPYGLLALAAAAALGRPRLGLMLFAWSVATRLALSLAVGRAVVKDESWFGLLVLYPIRDLMGFGFWLAGYWGNRILWRGRTFELLVGGKMRASK